MRIGANVANLPTDVGMYRQNRRGKTMGAESPHRRGDVPTDRQRTNQQTLISPQTWGCTDSKRDGEQCRDNLPTDVGMYRSRNRGRFSRCESPHRRGDVPQMEYAKMLHDVISPQTWGCTVGVESLSDLRCNLPTDVGMYRPSSSTISAGSKSPHRRGDVPLMEFAMLGAEEISPQTWGCTV